MKIAIITAGISTKSGLRVPVELAKALAKNNHQVFFYAHSKGKDQQIINELKKVNVSIRLIRKSSLFTQIMSFRKKILQDKPGIISAHCYASQLFAVRLTGIPTIWTYYGTQLNVIHEHTFPSKAFWITTADKLLNFFIKFRIRLMTLMADKIIAISLATAKELKNLYGKKATATIPLGSIPNNFNYLKEKTKTTSHSQKVTILSVSRITPYKGFHKIIKIVNNLSKKIPNLKLIIVGSAPISKYLSYLKTIARKNITFKLNISDQQLAHLYQNADIYVTADKFLFYGLPVWEASSFSLPTVSMNYQAASEAVIHNKTGLIANTQKQLEKNLEKLIKNPKLRLRFGKQAKQLALSRTWQKTALQYKKVFQKTLTNFYKPLISKTLLNMFKSKKNKSKLKLADLGSADGMNLRILDKLGLLRIFSKIIAVDLQKPKLSNLEKKYPQTKTLKANITNLKKIPPNTFEIIICSQVIEHIENQHQALKEITRILKPQGKLFISSVAKKWYGLYWHRNIKGEITVHPDHIHEFKSLKEFTNLIESSKLNILKTNQIPGKLQLFDYLIRIINLFTGKKSSNEHRNLYLNNPHLIKWHKKITLPLPGYSIIEAVAQKK